MGLDNNDAKQRLREKLQQRKAGKATTEAPIKTETDEMSAFADEMLNEAMGSVLGDESYDSTDDSDDFSIPEEDAYEFEMSDPPRQPSYQSDKDGNIKINNPTQTQKNNMYRITPDRTAVPEPRGAFAKHRRKLWENHNGISFSNKESFRQLLEAGVKALIGLGKVTSASDIRKIAIEDGIIRFHKFEIDPSNMLSPELGNTVYDLIEFKTLFKMFPLLNHLRLDSEATDIFTIKYGDDTNAIFQEVFMKQAKNLQILELNGGKTKITRSGFDANSVNKALKTSRMRSELDQISDGLNPKKDRMTKTQKHRAYQRSKSMKEHNWGAVKEFGINMFKNIGTVSTYAALAATFLTGHFILAGLIYSGLQSAKEMKSNSNKN